MLRITPSHWCGLHHLKPMVFSQDTSCSMRYVSQYYSVSNCKIPILCKNYGLENRPSMNQNKLSKVDLMTIVEMKCTNKPLSNIIVYIFILHILVNDTLDVGEVYGVNISRPDITQWVLHDLERDRSYKFYLSACTHVGCGPAISEGGTTASVACKYPLECYPLLD